MAKSELIVASGLFINLWPLPMTREVRRNGAKITKHTHEQENMESHGRFKKCSFSLYYAYICCCVTKYRPKSSPNAFSITEIKRTVKNVLLNVRGVNQAKCVWRSCDFEAGFSNRNVHTTARKKIPGL